MTLLFSSDWQCSVTNLERCQATVEQLVEILSTSKLPRYFVHLGDAKEAMNPVDQRVSNLLIAAFQRIRKNCNGTFFVRGNHDSITTQDGSPSLAPVIEAAGITGIADREVRSFTYASTRKSLYLWLVPYFRDPERQRRAFSEAKAEAAATRKKVPSAIFILAFHAELSGCRISPYAKGRGLSLDDIGAEQYNLCVGGHIHLQQKVADNVWYCGSPFPQDWGECNTQHGFLKVEL